MLGLLLLLLAAAAVSANVWTRRRPQQWAALKEWAKSHPTLGPWAHALSARRQALAPYTYRAWAASQRALVAAHPALMALLRALSIDPSPYEAVPRSDEAGGMSSSVSISVGGSGASPAPSPPPAPVTIPGLPGPALIPLPSSPTLLLTPEDAAFLAPALPTRCLLKDWAVAFSTHEHGYSVASLLSRCRGVGPTLLVVETEAGELLGGFAPRDWSRDAELGLVPAAASSSSVSTPSFASAVAPPSSYFGSGEAFVFSLRHSRGVWPWSRANNDFQYVHPRHGIALGGGGSFAVFLDEALEHGVSGASATFGNPPLVGGSSSGGSTAPLPSLPDPAGKPETPARDFKVVAVQVYCFTMPGSGGLSGGGRGRGSSFASPGPPGTASKTPRRSALY